MIRAEPVSGRRLVDTEFDVVVIGGEPGALPPPGMAHRTGSCVRSTLR